MPVEENIITPDTASPPKPQGPRRFSRKRVITTFVLTPFAMEAGFTILDFLQRIPPPFAPLSYEGVPQLDHGITFSEETVENGVRVVADGDSYQEGYQGQMLNAKGKVVDKPYTPSTKSLVEEQRAQGRNWTLEMHADQGETSDTTLEKAIKFWQKEYRARLDAKKAGIPYDPRPIWAWHWDNGNDARKPASDKKLSVEIAKLDRDGVWARPGEFDDSVQALDYNTRDMSNNIFLTLMTYRAMEKGYPPPGVDETEIIPIPMAGVQILLTWNKGEVPTLPFIPIAADTPVNRRGVFGLLNLKEVGKKVFNLAQDGMAKWGALISSQDVIRAYRYALQKFMTVAGDFIEKVSVLGTEQYVMYNNGTEHPNPHADYLIYRYVADNTPVKRKNGTMTTLGAITPKTYAV